MNKTNNIIWIITVIAFLGLSFVLYKIISTDKIVQKPTVEQTQESNDFVFSKDFSDGLKQPNSVTTYKLDEYEMGVSKKYVYTIDINNDNKNDRITKTFFENGNAHSYYKYTIELNDGKRYVDITPENLQTTNGADCDLRQIQFKFSPKFQIIVIYREMNDTWDEPTMAYKQIFTLNGDTLRPSQPKQIRPICDVKELF